MSGGPRLALAPRAAGGAQDGALATARWLSRPSDGVASQAPPVLGGRETRARVSPACTLGNGRQQWYCQQPWRLTKSKCSKMQDPTVKTKSVAALGTRNFREICLPDSRFAYEKFAYVSKEIRSWANRQAAAAARRPPPHCHNRIVPD